MKRLVPLSLLLSLLLLAVAPAVGCGGHAAPRRYSTYDYFDTLCVLHDQSGDGTAAFDERVSVFREVLSQYHRLLDIYHEYEDTVNLATLNRTAGTGPVEVSRELFDFLVYAKEIAALTQGRTNIAMGAVLSLWHEAREAAGEGEGVLPSEAALSAAAQHVDIDCLRLDEATLTVELTDPALRLDAGAIGKGYAAERLYERLAGMGVGACAIDLGGNLRTVGSKRDGTAFTAGIRDPEDGTQTVRTVPLTEGGCATSGSYERTMTVQGVSYHHIIDPLTLYPATYFVSVTVLARDAGLCDALSTALFCLPKEEAFALLSTLEGVRAVFITADGVQHTYGF